jgi:hypothetical protein
MSSINECRKHEKCPKQAGHNHATLLEQQGNGQVLPLQKEDAMVEG